MRSERERHKVSAYLRNTLHREGGAIVVYHRFACQMLSRLRLPYIDYLDKPRTFPGYEAIFEQIKGDEWAAALPVVFEDSWCSTQESASLMSEFCVEMLTSLDRDVEFIIDASPEATHAIDVINESIFDAAVPEPVRLQHDISSKEITERLGIAVKKSYKHDPRPKLHRRSLALAREQNEIECVIKFDMLFREVEFLNSSVHALALKLDEAIQFQIDVMRGK